MNYPGQIIKQLSQNTSGGYGTYKNEQDELVSSVLGQIKVINNFTFIESKRSKYSGNVGDVVIGRVLQVGNKRWKIDLDSEKQAVLHLTAIQLPEHRKRSEFDQLNMRQYFTTNDLLSGEVQTKQQDGTLVLHTRSEKYGKLKNGMLIKIPHWKIQRMKQHYITLECGVSLIISCNGKI